MKKRRRRNMTRRINNRFVPHPIVCNRCQKDGHIVVLATLYLIPDLDKPKVSFSNILFTLVWFCPLFWHCDHILKYLSTFKNVCPNFGIYVYILECMSTFASKCPHFRKYVHLLKYMTFFSLLSNVYTLVLTYVSHR